MSNPSTILNIAIPTPLRQCFDYLPPENCVLDQLVPGIRVQVPFGRRKLIGILIGVSDTSAVAQDLLKPAFEILDEVPLIPDNLMELALWASDYYHHPIGDVLSSCLPKLLRQGKSLMKLPLPMDQTQHEPASKLTLTDEQEHAVQEIAHSLNTFHSFLLDGVTGSGKTEVYLHIIERLLENDRQALVLVPEIGLTPQTVSRFQDRFSVPIAVLHSGLTDKTRFNGWQMAMKGEASIIIGTRSAIFTPLPKLGAIIVDEEHDLSFKQQDGFRYSARDVAIMRARMASIPVILGSATPSLESLYNASRKRFTHLKLTVRAGNAIKPNYRIIDVRNQHLESGLSQQLLTAMEEHLKKDGQVLLFINRRGYAPTLICHGCGAVTRCKHCDANLTLHLQPNFLQCHHCGSTRSVDKQCFECKSSGLYPLGTGTERLEQELNQLFPLRNIVRIDRDSTRRKGAIQNILDDINKGHSHILIGTQMLAKGHHFPNVTLVGILDADIGLFSADFRATEHMGQLLTQVSGRAGRAEKPGEVLIQTHNPQHPLLLQLIHKGYGDFSEALLNERSKVSLPPYAYFALVRADALKRGQALDFLKEVRTTAEANPIKNVQVLGPIPSSMEKRAGRYRAQLLLRSGNRPSLHEFIDLLLDQIPRLKPARSIRWSLDVDPIELF